jgi:hypothetical protein
MFRILAKFGLPLAAFAAALTPAQTYAQEDNPTTPGAIADPSTYQGSVALQQQESAADAAQSQQNSAMLQRLDDTYRQYAPGRSNAPPPIDWWKQPAVPPSKNPLLGSWRLGAYHAASTQQLGQTLGAPLAGLMALGGGDGTNPLSDFLEAGCQSIFGNGAITFEPDAFKMVNDDGRVEVHRAAYRSKGRDLVILTPDLGMIQSLFVGFTGHDHAVVAFLNCSLDRVGAMGSPSNSKAVAGTGAHLANLGQPPPAGPANATMKFQVGVTASGGFTPLPHAPVWVLTQDPQATAAAAGLALPAGTSLLGKLASDCHSIEVCKTEIVAIVHGALGRVMTDVNGQAQTPQIPAGRYYVVGVSNIQGRPLIWVQPVSVRPGVNVVTLDQKNGRSP